MKKGQILAIVVALVVVLALYLTSRTPQSVVAEPTQTEQTPEPEPTNELDAKVAEAVAIIQSGDGPPMRAIGLLREVITLDSNHLGALYWLGEFSVMSGQFERAIERFEKLHTLQPHNTEYCTKLAQAYAGSGQKEKGVRVLQQFKAAHPQQDVEQIEAVLKKLVLN